MRLVYLLFFFVLTSKSLVAQKEFAFGPKVGNGVFVPHLMGHAKESRYQYQFGGISALAWTNEQNYVKVSYEYAKIENVMLHDASALMDDQLDGGQVLNFDLTSHHIPLTMHRGAKPESLFKSFDLSMGIDVLIVREAYQLSPERIANLVGINGGIIFGTSYVRRVEEKASSWHVDFDVRNYPFFQKQLRIDSGIYAKNEIEEPRWIFNVALSFLFGLQSSREKKIKRPKSLKGKKGSVDCPRV